MLETAHIIIFWILFTWLVVTMVTSIWFIRELAKMSRSMDEVNAAVDEELKHPPKSLNN